MFFIKYKHDKKESYKYIFDHFKALPIKAILKHNMRAIC